MRNDYLTQALAEYQGRRTADGEREATTTIGGGTVTIGGSETVQSLDDTFLTGSSVHGTPRGRDAYAAREIAETQPMQLILNAIVDQLLGGEIGFVSDDEDVDQAEAEFRALVEDILAGPHLQGDDFDDLVSAAVADMVAVGNAYFEVLPPADGPLPVAALKPVDALSVRHNVDAAGRPEDPPYYQAPFRTAAGGVATVSDGDITALPQDDLVVMRYPGSKRSDRLYPLSPAMQVKEWLELIADSTRHHSRFYRDNELPPGVMSVREATQQDIDNLREELEAAKGDPRSAPVIGSDARWVEVGGSAVDLDVIQEQQWFIQLCAAAFGIPKTELGLVEDVNRNTSETQLTTVHKRVTQSLAKTIGQAITRQLLPQFNLYTQLDRPFDVCLRFSDPRQERAQEEHLRARYQAGGMTYREYREAVGDETSEEDTTVVINDQEIDYGEHPRHVVDTLLVNARNDDDEHAEAPSDAGDV